MPVSITSVSLVNSDSSSRGNISTITNTSTEMPIAIASPVVIVFWARLNSPPPIFCPAIEDMALLIASPGRMANEFILPTIP